MEREQAEQIIDLKPLKVIIMQAGEPVQVVEWPDPREHFIEDFNRRGALHGLEAMVA